MKNTLLTAVELVIALQICALNSASTQSVCEHVSQPQDSTFAIPAVPDSIVDVIGSALADQPSMVVIHEGREGGSYSDEWRSFLAELRAQYGSVLKPALQRLVFEAPRRGFAAPEKSVVRRAYFDLGFPREPFERALSATTVSAVARMDAMYGLFLFESRRLGFEQVRNGNIAEVLRAELSLGTCAVASEMLKPDTRIDGVVAHEFMNFMFVLQNLALKSEAARRLYADPLVTKARSRLPAFGGKRN
jgi:hypothetical protein